MKRFYPLWFVACAAWGYLLTMFPDHFKQPVTDMLSLLARSMFGFGVLTFLSLKFPPTTIELAHFQVELNPWNHPLGVFQFVFISFIFVGFWGAILSLIVPGGHIDMALDILAISTGGLIGGVIAAHLYRRWYRA